MLLRGGKKKKRIVRRKLPALNRRPLLCHMPAPRIEPGHSSGKRHDQSLRLGIRPVWSESSLCAQWVAKDPMFLHADSENSDQTGRMPRLIWVFAGRKPFCWFCHVVAHLLSSCAIQALTYIFMDFFDPLPRNLNMNQLMRLWHFSSSANSFFKRACAAIQWG